MYCIHCNKTYKGWNIFNSCDDHKSLESRDFPGVHVQSNFLTNEEAQKLVEAVDDNLGWDKSQSGRRKKNYGPKVNFKKKKLQVGQFQGFPRDTKFLREKLNDVKILRDFKTIEECYLEYDEDRGSHIDPHIDDCWIWGERILTVNCLGDSILSFIKHQPIYPQQYNIDLVEEYKNELICPLENFIDDKILIRVPMPEKSLMILCGPPRYQYEHFILREDIKGRRVAIAYREFTVPYLENGSKQSESEDFMKICMENDVK